MNDIRYSWDGEKIKADIPKEEKKFTPKEIIDALNHVRGQIGQMENNIAQAKQQIKQTEKSIESAKDYEKNLVGFEEKCWDLQKEKLEMYINKLESELKAEAMKIVEDILKKNPDNPHKKESLLYLEYQKLLGRNNKIAENISSKVITKYIYEEPIFSNPFKV